MTGDLELFLRKQEAGAAWRETAKGPLTAPEPGKVTVLEAFRRRLNGLLSR